MTLLLLNTYSDIYRDVKKFQDVSFGSYEDLSLDTTKTLRLNLAVPSVKFQKNKYKATRSLLNIVIYSTPYDTRNVFTKTIPQGYSPVITDDSNNIYRLNVDFLVLNAR